MLRSQGIWRNALAGAEVGSISAERRAQSSSVIVKITTFLPKVGAAWETDYDVYGSGDIEVRAHFKPNKTRLPDLVRLGMQMALPAGFECITWLGLGPRETYADRKDAKFGLYTSTVSKQFYAGYTRPGETGNKVDTRWVALSNGKVGLVAVGEPLLSVNALHYGTEDLNAAGHAFELPRRPYITLNLDLTQQGLGGDNSWGAWPHKAFLIPCQDYSYSFRLRPYDANQDPQKLARE